MNPTDREKEQLKALIDTEQRIAPWQKGRWVPVWMEWSLSYD